MPRSLVWLGRGLLALATLLALLIVLGTLALGVQAGWGPFKEASLHGILFAWPTIIALALLVASELRNPSPAAPVPRSVVIGVAVWVGSTVCLVVGGTSPSVRGSVALAVLAGIPVVLTGVSMAWARRASWRPASRAVLGVTMTLGFMFLMMPIALIVACGVAGECV